MENPASRRKPSSFRKQSGKVGPLDSSARGPHAAATLAGRLCGGEPLKEKGHLVSRSLSLSHRNHPFLGLWCKMTPWRGVLYPLAENREVREATGLGVRPYVVSPRELA